MRVKQTNEQYERWLAKAPTLDQFIVERGDGWVVLDNALPGYPFSRGLGDTVAKVVKAVTLGRVKPCGGCQKRREKLNKLLPYS